MALFCSPCNRSLISPSPSSPSFTIRHVSAFKPQFPSLPIFSFKPSILVHLSKKKPHILKCSGSSVEQHNDDDNSTTIIFLKVKIITDKKSKQSLGFAYIWFPDNESAQSAVEEMNGEMAGLYRFRLQSLDLASRTSSQHLISSRHLRCSFM